MMNQAAFMNGCFEGSNDDIKYLGGSSANRFKAYSARYIVAFLK
jgi:hypothetical protein